MKDCLTKATEISKTHSSLPLLKENRVIQSLWRGPPLSDMERMCIHSFIANGHEFHLYLYEDPGGVPEVEGLKIFDAAEIMPLPTSRYLSTGPDYLSNWFRWELLRQRGGWYADMDMVCLRPCNFTYPVIFGAESERRFNCAMVKCPAYHAVVCTLAFSYRSPQRTRAWDDEPLRYGKKCARWLFWQDSPLVRWSESEGIDYFTKMVKRAEMQAMVEPRMVFFPFGCKDISVFTLDGGDTDLINRVLAGSMSVCLWRHLWTRENQDPNATYHYNSLYERLKRQYLPAD